ncbi:MAG: glycosyltransferase family 2 protein [Phycisphaerales bacterium]|nr:glycosyltransferase family 2 protein [Phycisphaerales bacterium]
MSVLVAIPVFNEAAHVRSVLERVREFADQILVIDDGSSDGTPGILCDLRQPMGLDIIQHETNQGYGTALIQAFRRAERDGFDWVITMDCDDQHEPERLPEFFGAIREDTHDIISGSRYLDLDGAESTAPADRRSINMKITAELNDRLGLTLTDGFCGFKAHRVDAMKKLDLTETGYAFPMQLWVQAVANGLRITEIPVELIYNDLTRTFGGGLDIAEERLRHYRCVMHRTIDLYAHQLPPEATQDINAECLG